jgi:transposase
LHKGAVRSRQIVVFLRHLARHIPGPIVLIWDGLNAHRSRETRAFFASAGRRFSVVRLPAYSPDLNPVEGLWGWLKGHVVPNLCAPDLQPVGRGVRRGCRHLARRPDTLAGFLARTGLSF